MTKPKPDHPWIKKALLAGTKKKAWMDEEARRKRVADYEKAMAADVAISITENTEPEGDMRMSVSKIVHGKP